MKGSIDMKEILHKGTLFIYDEENTGIGVTSNLYEKHADMPLKMDITAIAQNVDNQNDYVYTLAIYSNFIRIYRFRDVANDFGPRSSDVILDIDNGNITFNNVVPVNVWNEILSILQQANTKINGIDIADYLSSYNIYRTRVA